MTAPKRIQMSRTRPWRAEHPDAVIVDRRTKWGNPYPVGDEVTATWLGGEMAMLVATPEMAVAAFRFLMAGRLTRYANDLEDDAYVSHWEQGLEGLRGRDLACWCTLDQPCHADVLLELANPPRGVS
jgi:hypothetical protein